MAPLDLLIITLVVFNVVIGVVFLFVLVQAALLARKINRLTDDVTETYRSIARFEFLPSLLSLLLDRRTYKK